MDPHKRKQKNISDWEWFTEFAGMHMPSNYYTFHLFSKIFGANRHLQQIFEFGTYHGSMGVALGLESIRLNIPMISFDVQDQRDLDTKRIFDTLGITFAEADLFAKETQDKIKEMLNGKPTYLLIDNGNKKKEFEIYVPMLASGSIVSCHDYGTEFTDEDWQIHKHLVEPYMQEEWTNHNVEFATFKVK